MCHHLIRLVKSEVRSNGPDIFESETELNKMKKKKKKSYCLESQKSEASTFLILTTFQLSLCLY